MSSDLEVQFRPFQLEAQSAVAGSHDGTKATVGLTFSTDVMTVNHESVHERIFATTPDGAVLALILRLITSSNPSAPSIPVALEESMNRLLDASRFAHEVAATYLGIKILSPADQLQAVNSLPEKPDNYRSYYQALSKLIDVVFPSTYIQSILGWSIANVTFSSPLLARFVEADFNSPLEIDDTEHPEKRMRSLMNVLQQNDLTILRSLLERTVAETSRELGVEPWDMYSDEAWEAHHAIGSQVEVALSSVARVWFQRASGLSVLEGEALHRAQEKLATQLRPYGITLEFANVLDIFHTHYPLDQLIEVYWQAASVTANTKTPITLPRMADDFLASDNEILQSLHSFHIVSAYIPQHLAECNILAWRDPPQRDQPLFEGRFSMDATLDWLARRRDDERQRSPVPHVHSIVIATQVFEDLAKILPDFYEKTTFSVGRGTVSGSTASAVCWYWVGNWIELVHFLAKNQPVQLATFYPETMDAWAAQQQNKGSFSQFPELCIKLLRVPGVLGFFVRAFNFRSIAYINAYEEALKRKGVVQDLENNLTAFASDQISSAITLVKDFWPTF